MIDSWQYEILNGQSYGAKFILGKIAGVQNYKNKEDKLEGLEILDDYTLQISLNEADYDFLYKLTHINTSVFSAKSFSNENPKNLIGTGPFKLIDQTNEKITLELNNNYFQGAPSVDRIEYTTITNPAAEYQKFLAGEIDYYHQSITKDGKKYENIINSDFPDIYYIAINCQYAPFNNEKIRQALNYAVNRENFTKFFNSVSISNTILPSNIQQSDSSKIVFPYIFNPQEARKILDENGYSSTYLGQEFTLVYPDSDPSFKSIAEKVQENLIDIGINLRLESKNAKELAVIYESSAQPAFLLTSFQYIPFPGSELYFLKSAFSTQNKGNYGNYGLFSSSIVDALLSSYNEITEKEKKTGAYIEIENTLLREAPWIFMMSRNKKIIRQNYLSGISIGQYGINLRKTFLINSGEPSPAEEKN
ncbi:ABC transporter substrate-binding protein [Candidatus Desantisbacteria bacterium]|nr:ABC transporter substrate-binding protein [Candidatus Desantisbacteria bacterium]